jgi:beta-lactamase class A
MAFSRSLGGVSDRFPRLNPSPWIKYGFILELARKRIDMKPKKWSLLMALFIFSPLVSAPCSWGADLDSLRKAVKAEIARSGAEVSLAFKDLQTGETLFIKEKDMVHAASTMKVPVLIEVFKQAEDGKFGLDDRIVIKNEFHSIVDGSPFSLNKEDDSDLWTHRNVLNDPGTRREDDHR